jgi:hypothetical protein
VSEREGGREGGEEERERLGRQDTGAFFICKLRKLPKQARPPSPGVVRRRRRLGGGGLLRAARRARGGDG